MKAKIKTRRLVYPIQTYTRSYSNLTTPIQDSIFSRRFGSVCYRQKFQNKVQRVGLIYPVPRRLLLQDDRINSESNEGERKVFYPQEPIYYADGKYNVFQASKNHIVKFFIGANGIMLCYSTFKMISKLVLFKPLGFIIWGALFGVSGIAVRNGLAYGSRYIRSINLIQNGARVEILNLMNGRLLVRPFEIRKPSQSQLLQFKIVSLPEDLYPVIVRNQLYMIQSRGKIEHLQIFKAVINGFQIDEQKLKSKDDEDIIDI